MNSPHITKAGLFETSGHLDWFADGMFPPMHFEDEGGDAGQDYYLKPMNCPFHCLIFRQPHAQLPRAAAAPLRVRRRVPLREVRGGPRAHARAGDDAGRRPHLLHQGEHGRGATPCSPSCSSCLADYGLDDFYLELSTKPPARRRLRRGLGRGDRDPPPGRRGTRTSSWCSTRAAAPSTDPKISVQATDAIGRTWQMSTIQLDFQEPARFEHSSTSAPTTSATRRS